MVQLVNNIVCSVWDSGEKANIRGMEKGRKMLSSVILHQKNVGGLMGTVGIYRRGVMRRGIKKEDYFLKIHFLYLLYPD